MTATTFRWDDDAELLETAICGKGWGGARAPARVMKGPLGDIAGYLKQQDIEDIWRFTVVMADGQHIRSAELRALIRSDDPSA